MSDLPNGWAESCVKHVCELQNGRAYKQDELLSDGKYPVLRVGNFFSNRSWYYSDLELESEKYCDDGDLLYAWSASFGPKIWDGGKVIFHYHIWRVDVEHRLIDKRFLFHWFEWDKENIKSDLGTGSTMIHVTKGGMEARALMLPPIPEQRRIVAKVDGFTARTARARKELDRIPTLIARYKQRLLALAFSGELTAGWRKANPTMQTALEKVRASRKTDTRLARRKRSASLPDYDLPAAWAWISPDEVVSDAKYSIGIGPFGSNLVRTDYRESGVRLVFVRDIRREKFEDSDARYVDKSKAAELHQHIASPGDVLITKMGDPPGDSALFPMDAEPAVITADCIKLTPHDQLVKAKYLNFAIRSEIVQSQFKAITAGVAQQKVSLDRFRQLALPIAPLEEQAEIVRRIESAFGWLDRVAADHAAAARLLPKLDAAILAKAFRGELVPQDPNDEPANVLLDRIKRERGAEGKKPKSGRGRKPNGSKAMTEKPLLPRDRLLKDSEKWPAVGLPFEAIAMRNPIPHDALRDALFELLSGASPVLQQRFDADAEVMVIQRVAA